MVNAEVPRVAFFFAERVNVDVPALTIDTGVNFPVTSFGNPLTDRVTVPVNPAAMLTVYDPLSSRAMVALVGDTDIEKSLLMVSVTPTVWLIAPFVPVIVSGYVPTDVDAVVDTWSVVAPDVRRFAGVNEAVAPEGRPATLNVTVPTKPEPGVSVTVKLPLLPRGTLCDVGLADSE